MVSTNDKMKKYLLSEADNSVKINLDRIDKMITMIGDVEEDLDGFKSGKLLPNQIAEMKKSVSEVYRNLLHLRKAFRLYGG